MKQSEKFAKFMSTVRCPVCQRKNFRYMKRSHSYSCLVCGCGFDVNYEKKEVTILYQKGDQT